MTQTSSVSEKKATNQAYANISGKHQQRKTHAFQRVHFTPLAATNEMDRILHDGVNLILNFYDKINCCSFIIY